MKSKGSKYSFFLLFVILTSIYIIGVISCSKEKKTNPVEPDTTSPTTQPKDYTVKVSTGADDATTVNDGSLMITNNYLFVGSLEGYQTEYHYKTIIRFNLSSWKNGDVTFHFYLYNVVYTENNNNIEVLLNNDIGIIGSNSFNFDSNATYIGNLLNNENLGWKTIKIPSNKISSKISSNGYITIILRLVQNIQKAYYFRAYEYGGDFIPYATWTQTE